MTTFSEELHISHSTIDAWHEIVCDTCGEPAVWHGCDECGGWRCPKCDKDETEAQAPNDNSIGGDVLPAGWSA